MSLETQRRKLWLASAPALAITYGAAAFYLELGPPTFRGGLLLLIAEALALLPLILTLRGMAAHRPLAYGLCVASATTLLMWLPKVATRTTFLRIGALGFALATLFTLHLALVYPAPSGRPHLLGKLFLKVTYAGVCFMLAVEVAAALGAPVALTHVKLGAVLGALALLGGTTIIRTVRLCRETRALWRSVHWWGFSGTAIAMALAALGPLFWLHSPDTSLLLGVLALAVLCGSHSAMVDAKWQRRFGSYARHIFAAGCATLLLVLVLDQLRDQLRDQLHDHVHDAFAFSLAALALLVGAGAAGLTVMMVLNRRAAPFQGRLLRATRCAEQAAPLQQTLEDFSQVLLGAFRSAGRQVTSPSLYTVDPPQLFELTASGDVRSRGQAMPPQLLHAFGHGSCCIVTQTRAPRSGACRKERELQELLEELELLAAVSFCRDGHFEGVALLPRGARRSSLALEELDALQCLSERAGASLAKLTAAARATRRWNQAEAKVQKLDAHARDLEGALEQESRRYANVVVQSALRPSNLSASYSASMHSLFAQLPAQPLDRALLLHDWWTSSEDVAFQFHLMRRNSTPGPFISIDATQIATQLAMNQLFGRGDALGWLERATHGTLLIRHIFALDPHTQDALAAGISKGVAVSSCQSRNYAMSAAVVGTSVVPLRGLEKGEGVNAQLLDLLSQQLISVPSLEERTEDLGPRALEILTRTSRALALEPMGIEPEALQLLADTEWTGGFAEFDMVLTQAALRTKGPRVTVKDLRLSPRGGEEAMMPRLGTYHEMEREILLTALVQSGWNKTRTARALGLKRTTLLDKLKRHELGSAEVVGAGSEAG